MDIGIDLGTTFSVIAVHGKVVFSEIYPPGIYLEKCNVTVIPTPEGEPTFASVVIEDPNNSGSFLFAREAAQKAEEGLAPIMFSKRKIGTSEVFQQPTTHLTARQVATHFLGHLKRCAEMALGRRVHRAVITHPAYFDRSAVEETKKAAIDAGFDMSLPEQMLMEPVAAALAYTRTDDRDPLRIITYDLGGGTFDVTYLERNGGVIEIRAFDGDHLMGGYNFDREIADWMIKRLQSKGRRISIDPEKREDRGRYCRLLQICEKIKIDLSQAPDPNFKVSVRLRDVLVDTDGKPIQVNESLSRAQFVELIRPYLNSALECCRRTVQKAGAKDKEIHEVLLVGGSSYGRWVMESLKTEFPKTSVQLFEPDLCVGVGAAIHAKMSLPALVQAGALRLTLDVPEVSALPTILVTGRAVVVDGAAASKKYRALLRYVDGKALQPVDLDEDARFAFEEVALSRENATTLMLTIEDGSGAVALEHLFSIRYAPELTESSTITTVLPRALSVLTQVGMTPLAKEGAALPAKCKISFQRANDHPNIALEIFQERQPMGVVRIENIPPQAGRDAFVDLSIEITEKNQVRGSASIRTAAGMVVASKEICIEFSVPEIPAEDALRAAWLEMQEGFETWQARSEPKAEMDVRQASECMENLRRLFSQAILERQEVYHFLRTLEPIIYAKPDEMYPTWTDFCALLEDCRRQTSSNQTTTLTALQQLENNARPAHLGKDHKVWADINHDLSLIAATVIKLPNIDTISTEALKDSLTFELAKVLHQLSLKAEHMQRGRDGAHWQGRIAALEKRLQQALQEITAVSDNLPSAQGLVKLRNIYQTKILCISSEISQLGIDITNPIK